MATVKELADRVAALEAEVARLKAKVEAPDRSGEDWLDKVSGVFADDPDYLEIVRLGRKWRESFRPKRRKRQKS
jgi:Protein of unknown function (DUF1192)